MNYGTKTQIILLAITCIPFLSAMEPTEITPASLVTAAEQTVHMQTLPIEKRESRPTWIRESQTIAPGKTIISAACSVDGSLLACGREDGMSLRSLDGRSSPMDIEGLEGCAVTRIVFSPDNQILTTCILPGGQHAVALITASRKARGIAVCTKPLTGLACNQHDGSFATSTGDGLVKIYPNLDGSDASLTMRIPGDTSCSYSTTPLAFACNNTLLVSRKNKLSMYDIRQSTVAIRHSFKESIQHCSTHLRQPDYFALGTGNNKVTLWDYRAMREPLPPTKHHKSSYAYRVHKRSNDITSLALCPVRKQAVFVGTDHGKVAFIDRNDAGGIIPIYLKKNKDGASVLALSPVEDGEKVVTVFSDATVEVYSRKKREWDRLVTVSAAAQVIKGAS